MKAILFDFDYTLGDSTKGIISSVNFALNKLGYQKRDEETIRKTIGLSLRDTFFELEPEGKESEAEQFSRFFKEKADEVMVPNTELYPGVREILQAIKKDGYQIGIVTTKFHYRIEQIFSRQGILELIDQIVGAEDVKVEKPNPEGLLLAIDRLQLQKEDILYVGDSLADAKTAENAGVSFAAVLTGTTSREDFEPYRTVHVGNGIKDIYEKIRT